ncbi:hypothetical protein LWC34_42470 [Kibdelosporangium philippinense]|uniref:Uncharacterized protein n=1 Tax=Kibdelosporangium philippinense TaxID=211113 RepID=A0ABS8ZNV1_9PSEU|nr:hypothetical protein [Kibdelosporangium philippinense]MCE7009436.1 hypothetical protein [Kibdelosporangium philippinense]
MSRAALSRTVIKCDIRASSAGSRYRQIELDKGLKEVLDRAFDAARGTKHPIEDAYVRFDGDSITMVVDANVPRSWLLADFILRELRIALDEYNRSENAEHQLRLRVAVTFGEIVLNPPAISGDAVIRAARLVDAAELRKAMDEKPSVSLGLIVDEKFLTEVIQHRERGLDPTRFKAVAVDVKDFDGKGWIHMAEEAPEKEFNATVVNRFENSEIDARGAVIGVNNGTVNAPK